MSDELTIAEIQRQVRELKDAKGFDITLEQRLTYLMTEVGEVARETLKISRDGNDVVGKTSAAGVEPVAEALGMEIYDVIWNLLDLAGVKNLEETFYKKASLNEGREW